jgi:hypothetical protein
MMVRLNLLERFLSKANTSLPVVISNFLALQEIVSAKSLLNYARSDYTGGFGGSDNKPRI